MKKTESGVLEGTSDIRTRLRLARLQSVQMEVPEDAKSPEEMLQEIKDKISKRT